MLAQSLIRADREQALFRLGISEETATLIATLSPAQMLKIAAGNTLLCRFRMRRIYELYTFGRSGEPLALGDAELRRDRTLTRS